MKGDTNYFEVVCIDDVVSSTNTNTNTDTDTDTDTDTANL